MIKRANTQFSTMQLSILLLVLWVQPVNAADWLYSIRPGDTLWSVCAQYAKEPGCWQKLGPLNQIDQNRQIPPGTRIRMPASWLKIPAASATITFTQGEVKYQHFGEAETNAKKGVKLPIGSQLTTGDGIVTIIFADGSSMVLEPHSQLELDTLSHFELNGMVDSTVRLKRGTVKTRVIKREPRSQFRTVTPSAVAAVRGTEYRVNIAAADKKTTRKETTLIEVYEGLVDVGAEQKTYPVPATFGIVTEQGQAPQPPVRLLDKPIFLPFDEQQTLMASNSTGTQHAPIDIAWQAVDNVSQYQLNILTDATKDKPTAQLLQSYRASDNQIQLTSLSVGCYQLSLRAIDTLGLHGLAANKRLCLTEQLSAPVFKAQNAEVQIGAQASIAWDAVIGAQNYAIEVSEIADFSTLLQSSQLNEGHFQLEHPSELFFRVQAFDKNGRPSPFSQPLHWQPKKEVVVVEETEYWPIYLQFGLALLALL